MRFKLDPQGCLIVKKVDQAGKPLEGWKITAVGVVDPEGKTDANGVVRFDSLSPGAYVVSEEVPYPWKAITPSSTTVQVKPALKDGDCATVEFKNERQPTACITGLKVDDQHRPLAGWTIHAKSAGGYEVASQKTGPDGRFTFKDLTLGTWTLWEDVQQWWTPVTPSKFTVPLTQASDKCVEVRFKNRAPDVCADGYKLDENGRGLAGWTIKAYSKADPATVFQATTDAYGYYRFNGLAMGAWIFEEVRQTGWTAISAEKVEVNLTGAMCNRIPTFRNKSPQGCVEGYKRDDKQAGLPGWNISLQPKGGGFYRHADTDGTGYFRFDNLPMGEYEVWEEGQTGWAPTSPTRVTVKLTPSDDKKCAPVEFINKQIPRDICIDGYKLDVNGLVGLPGFTVTAKPVGSSAVMTATTDGLGYFRFGNLNPGTYEVKVTEKTGWAPVGSLGQYATVAWPPKFDCTRLKFYDRQSSGGSSSGGTMGCRLYHTVRQGDTLSGLAVWYGVKLDVLMAANGITNANTIYWGSKLCIP